MSTDPRPAAAAPEGELDRYAVECRAHSSEVRELLAPLSQAQASWRPRPERWSVGEHIEHLAITNRRYLRPIATATADARARGLIGSGPFRHPLLGNLFAWSMEPPVRLRLPTLSSLVPERQLASARVLDDFVSAQRALEGAIQAAAGVDLGRTRMRSPFVKSVRMSLGQAFRAILAHNRRHIWHCRRVLQAPGFPSAPVTSGTTEA